MFWKVWNWIGSLVVITILTQKCSRVIIYCCVMPRCFVMLIETSINIVAMAILQSQQLIRDFRKETMNSWKISKQPEWRLLLPMLLGVTQWSKTEFRFMFYNYFFMQISPKIFDDVGGDGRGGHPSWLRSLVSRPHLAHITRNTGFWLAGSALCSPLIGRYRVPTGWHWPRQWEIDTRLICSQERDRGQGVYELTRTKW